MEAIMAKKIATVEENRKTFEDRTFSNWITDDDGNVKVGESLKKILKGDCENLSVKEIIYGEPSNTWRIIITNDERTILLKSSREMK